MCTAPHLSLNQPEYHDEFSTRGEGTSRRRILTKVLRHPQWERQTENGLWAPSNERSVVRKLMLLDLLNRSYLRNIDHSIRFTTVGVLSLSIVRATERLLELQNSCLLHASIKTTSRIEPRQKRLRW